MSQIFDAALDELAGIARYEVSEDGIAWRPYDPRGDALKALHKRIEFADIEGLEASDLVSTP